MTATTASARVHITRAKFDAIPRCANERGIIAALAMDQRGSLRQAIKEAASRSVDTAELAEFKALVTEVLSSYASAMLLDLEFGLPAVRRRAPDAGVLLAMSRPAMIRQSRALPRSAARVVGTAHPGRGRRWRQDRDVLRPR